MTEKDQERKLEEERIHDEEIERWETELPAVSGMDEVTLQHMREMADTLSSFVPRIRMVERKALINVDGEEVNSINDLTIHSVTHYKGLWETEDGEMVLRKFPVLEDVEGGGLRADLDCTWMNEDYEFQLSKTGYESFLRFWKKWTARGYNIFGGEIGVTPELVKTKLGYTVNIPKFKLIRPAEEPRREYKVEVEDVHDDMPF
jgi:hypothetical protein